MGKSFFDKREQGADKESEGEKGQSNKDKESKKKRGRLKGKFKTRRESIIAELPPCLKKSWFNDDEEQLISYANWVIEQEELETDRILADKESEGNLQKKLMKHNKLKLKSADDIIAHIREEEKIIKKASKRRRKITGQMDVGVVRFLDPKRYNKKYLDKDDYIKDYRQEIKRLAEMEKMERKEIGKFGLVNEIDNLIAMGDFDKIEEFTMSESYSIKHPI
jgi:hypothetical protein